MTDRELLTAGNVAELTARHRPALLEVVNRRIRDEKAAPYIADHGLEQAFRNAADWEDEKESFRSWLFYNARALAQSWQAPAPDKRTDLEMEVHESMRADHGDDYEAWPQGEYNSRLDAAMRETFSQAPYVDNDDYFA